MKGQTTTVCASPIETTDGSRWDISPRPLPSRVKMVDDPTDTQIEIAHQVDGIHIFIAATDEFYIQRTMGANPTFVCATMLSRPREKMEALHLEALHADQLRG